MQSFLKTTGEGNELSIEFEVIVAAADHSIGIRPCISCGQRIPKSRLDVMPNALRCGPCQSGVEQSGDFLQYFMRDWRELAKVIG